ncbi:sensor histidine kinase [Gracilibacillus oryzae]|uniref:Sensor histidine kinase n=1 Tax=Gracilibacillus oryzae TaxID=1672701 RepID=A0A7C8GR20_9BACI|nr:ATP-binding protein [Gracilibacillus oryzae]KAB8127451.1 sensor histidine kinase [Gracilibacillus oryzae]
MRKYFSRRKRNTKRKKSIDDQSNHPSYIINDSYDQLKSTFTIAWIVSQLAIFTDKEKHQSLFMKLVQINGKSEIEDQSVLELYELAEQGLDWIKNSTMIENELSKLSYPKGFLDHFYQLLKQIQMSEMIVHTKSDWKVYRDVLFSATQGKLLLISSDKVDQYKKGEHLCTAFLMDKHDIAYARNKAKKAFEEILTDGDKIMSYQLIISEAVTNVIKHANNGKMNIYQTEDEVYVVIEDNGPGFLLSEIPKATLLAGFSTKSSLGQGFTLMMKMAKQLLLETSSNGSTLILVLDK